MGALRVRAASLPDKINELDVEASIGAYKIDGLVAEYYATGVFNRPEPEPQKRMRSAVNMQAKEALEWARANVIDDHAALEEAKQVLEDLRAAQPILHRLSKMHPEDIGTCFYPTFGIDDLAEEEDWIESAAHVKRHIVACGDAIDKYLEVVTFTSKRRGGSDQLFPMTFLRGMVVPWNMFVSADDDLSNPWASIRQEHEGKFARLLDLAWYSDLRLPLDNASTRIWYDRVRDVRRKASKSGLTY
jgi:hypothetical protein